MAKKGTKLESLQAEQNEKEKMLEQTFKNLSQFDISRIKKMFAVKEKITQFLNMLLTCEDISTTLDLIKDTISEVNDENEILDNLSESSNKDDNKDKEVEI